MEVIFLLGVIWAAVLVPQWLENRRDSRPTASITSFNRKLWSLERTTPTYDDTDYGSTYGVAPAAPGRRTRVGPHDGPYVNDDPYEDEPYAGDLVRDVSELSRAWADPDAETDASWVPEGAPAWRGPAGGDRVRTAAVTTLDAARSRSPRRLGGDLARPGPTPPGPDGAVPAGRVVADRRAPAVRRRRQVFVTLLGVAVATAVPAAWVGGAWWAAHAVADLFLFAYVFLLVRRQRRLAERAMKVHVLSPARAPRPLVVVLGPAGSTGTAR